MDVVDTEVWGWGKFPTLTLNPSAFAVSDPASQFSHRKVTVKRSRDVRSNYDMKEEIGR